MPAAGSPYHSSSGGRPFLLSAGGEVAPAYFYFEYQPTVANESKAACITYNPQTKHHDTLSSLVITQLQTYVDTITLKTTIYRLCGCVPMCVRIYSMTEIRCVHVMCMCFCFFSLGPAVPPGYRPRFPHRGEGRLGESAQRRRRWKLLRFRVPVAASVRSRDRVPRPAGSDRPGLSAAVNHSKNHSVA